MPRRVTRKKKKIPGMTAGEMLEQKKSTGKFGGSYAGGGHKSGKRKSIRRPRRK